MNYTHIVSQLRDASAFDLFRLRAAISRILDQPDWAAAVRSRLQVGMTLTYFDEEANKASRGQLLEMRRKHALVLEIETGKRWLISYAAINLDGADIAIREQAKQGLSRQSLATGDVVGFVDRDQKERVGRVLRLNDKSVSLQVGKTRWRVAYSLLHRVVDSSTYDGDFLEISFDASDMEIIVDPD